jgi:hypothetical protein
MVSRPLFIDVACLLVRLPVVYACVFGVIALIIWLSIGKYDCSHVYYLWQCFHDCNASNHSNTTTFCSTHSGEYGVDIGLINLVTSTVSAGVAILLSLLTVAKLFFFQSGSAEKDFHLKLVGYLAVHDVFYAATILLASSFLLDTTLGTEYSSTCTPYASTIMALNAFAWISEFLWHSILVSSVYLMVSNAELFRRRRTHSRLFPCLLVGVWGVSAALVLVMWLEKNFVAWDSPPLTFYPCNIAAPSVSLLSVTILFTFGALQAVFVCVYTFRKLDLRLLRSGDFKRTRSALFLLKIVGVFYLVCVLCLLGHIIAFPLT